MLLASPTIKAPKERPLRLSSNGVIKPTPSILPSMVECQGRTTSIAFSERRPRRVAIGGDVAAPQIGDTATGVFHGYAAGGGNDGSGVSYPNKKVCSFREGPDYALWLSGSNGSGAIWRRDPDDDVWDLVTQSFWGTSNDGGSSDPRRTGSGLIVMDGTLAFMSCERAASPTNGIARSTDSGANWTAWSFGTSRNYTSLRKSPNWEYLLATSDGRVGASQDGVWLLKGLSSTASVTQWDTIGTGAPDLADVRNCYVVDENGDDCWFIVVGNAAGSDADRGIWRLRVTHDPNDGGFVAGTHMTWTHIYTPGSSDRVQSVVAAQPEGTTGTPIYVAVFFFSSPTTSGGTYVLSEGAGGTTKTYRVRGVRTLNAEASSPTWEVISGSPNVDMTTYGTNHEHVMTYVGEQSNEQSRYGGNSYQNQDADISADGNKIAICGKSSPWICTNPWDDVPVFRPFSRGLGLLEGSYQSVYVPDIDDGTGRHGIAFSDDDRGMYTFIGFNRMASGPEWVVAENIDGATTTDNAMYDVQVDVGSPLTLLLARRLNGRVYRVTNPWDYDTAIIATISPDTSANPPAIGGKAWVDGASTDRRLIVTEDKIWRNTTVVKTGLGTTAKRCDFVAMGSNAWLHIPDKGVYRSTDNGLTWTLWWDNGIANGTTNRYAGHIALLPPTTLLVTFDTAGIWECTGADTSSTGSGVGGSRPGSTSQIVSGDLTAGDFVSAMDLDPVRNEVWATGYDPTGATPNTLWVRRGNTWVEKADEEYAESAIIPQSLTAYDGCLIIGTASNGTLVRMI